MTEYWIFNVIRHFNSRREFSKLNFGQKLFPNQHTHTNRSKGKGTCTRMKKRQIKFMRAVLLAGCHWLSQSFSGARFNRGCQLS